MLLAAATLEQLSTPFCCPHPAVAWPSQYTAKFGLADVAEIAYSSRSRRVLQA